MFDAVQKFEIPTENRNILDLPAADVLQSISLIVCKSSLPAISY